MPVQSSGITSPPHAIGPGIAGTRGSTKSEREAEQHRQHAVQHHRRGEPVGVIAFELGGGELARMLRHHRREQVGGIPNAVPCEQTPHSIAGSGISNPPTMPPITPPRPVARPAIA